MLCSQWESKVERGQQEFDTISRVIKKELERWDELRLNELRAALLRYLDDHMKHQAQVNWSHTALLHYCASILKTIYSKPIYAYEDIFIPKVTIVHPNSE